MDLKLLVSSIEFAKELAGVEENLLFFFFKISSFTKKLPQNPHLMCFFYQGFDDIAKLREAGSPVTLLVLRGVGGVLFF